MIEDKALIRQYVPAHSGKDKLDSFVKIYVSDEKLKLYLKLFIQICYLNNFHSNGRRS